jgi:monoterpene epsilon-lactone hydrolase
MPLIHHPISAADRVANAAFRAALASYPPMELVPATREFFDTFMQTVPAAPGVTFAASDAGGCAGIWCHPAQTQYAGAILYLHGGAYNLGSAAGYRNVASQIAARTGAAVFVADYRLAPEHRFPAAFDDAMAAYAALVRDYPVVALAGDSAGGGLALAIPAALAATAMLAPAAVAVMSPWTDLTLAHDSHTSRAPHDPLLSRAALEAAASHYAAGSDRRDPRMSPMHGIGAAMPPVFIQVGADEVLLDDTVRYIEAMDARGNTAEAHVWEGMTHVFPTNFTMFAAAETAMAQLCANLQRRLGGDMTA